MRRTRPFPVSLWLIAAACGGLAGCGDRAAQEAAAGTQAGATTAATAAGTAATASAASATSTAAAQARVATAIEGRITAGGSVLSFGLFVAPGSDASGGVMQVRSIEIRTADGSVVQRIDGLDTRTPWSEQFRGLELVDLDFDGFADLRLVDSQPAGPDLTYRNWRYDAATRRFVASPELDALPGLHVDAAARELRSSWRDGPANYGVDIWTYNQGRLVPVRRERRHYSRPGAYTLEVSHPQAGGWKVTQRRQGRDQ